MSLTDEWQALKEHGPDAFDADPSNGEYDPDDGTVNDPEEATESLAEDTRRQTGQSGYNGHPRIAYTYTGTDQQAYEQWVDGTISTRQFQTRTPRGQGTAALELDRSLSGGIPPVALVAVAAIGAVFVIKEVNN